MDTSMSKFELIDAISKSAKFASFYFTFSQI
jgi:hypothetical protein